MKTKNLFIAVIAIAVLLTPSQSAHAQVQLQRMEKDTTVVRGKRTGDTTPVITITTQPVDVVAVKGFVTGRLTVAASVTQGATPSYQWYSNKEANNTGGRAISGATNASFTLSADLSGGKHYYYCEVNAPGAVPVCSNVVRVVVNDPVITITKQPADVSFREGYVQGSLSVAANVTSGAALSYQWYSNPSAGNTGSTAISGATNAVFSLPATLSGGKYYYFCEVRSSGANPVRSNAATVTVMASPQPVITITRQPDDVSFPEGVSFENGLSVEAKVTQGATLSYQWYSNTSASNTGGTALSNATKPDFILPRSLTAGKYFYFCEVGASGANPVRSKVATVAVRSVTISSTSKSVEAGNEVTYDVITKNTANATEDWITHEQWFKDASGTSPVKSFPGIAFATNLIVDSSGKGKFTIATTKDALPGKYYFRITSPATSNIVELVVK